jgi:hypothetical protein
MRGAFIVVVALIELAACRSSDSPRVTSVDVATRSEPIRAASCSNECMPDETFRVIRRTDDELHLCLTGGRVRVAASIDDGVHLFPNSLLPNLERELAAGLYGGRHDESVLAEVCKWNEACRVWCWTGAYAVAATNSLRVSVLDWSAPESETELSIVDRASGRELARAYHSPPRQREAPVAVEECAPWRVGWFRTDGRLKAVVHKASVQGAEVEVVPRADVSAKDAARAFDVIPAGTNNLCSAQPPDSNPLATPFATLIPTDEQRQGCSTNASTSFCEFLAVELDWPAYAAIRPPEDKSNSQLVAFDKKKKQRDELAKRYFDLAEKLQDEWGVAASCRAAETLLDYANFILEVEPPPKKPEENPFIDRLWTMSVPVQEQALQQLDRMAELATARGVDNAYVRRCNRERAAVETWLSDPYRAPLPLRARK